MSNLQTLKDFVYEGFVWDDYLSDKREWLIAPFMLFKTDDQVDAHNYLAQREILIAYPDDCLEENFEDLDRGEFIFIIVRPNSVAAIEVEKLTDNNLN